MITGNYPHYEITVEDKSFQDVHIERELPLFRPLMYVPAQKGVPNEPMLFNSINEAMNVLGEETFNVTNKKYYTPAIDIIQGILRRGSCFIARADDGNSMPSVLLIALEVTYNTAMTRFKVDPITGEFEFTINGTGDKVYTPSTEVPTSMSGVGIKYRKYTDLKEILKLVYGLTDAQVDSDQYKGRKAVEKLIQNIEGNTLLHTVVPSTVVGTGGNKTAIVPIYLTCAKYPGLYGDDIGLSVNYNRKDNSTKAVQTRKGFIYEFGPFKKKYGTINTVAIKSRFGSDFFTAGLTKDMTDVVSKIDYTVDNVIGVSYPETKNDLGFKIYPFFNNITLLSIVLSEIEDSIEKLKTPIVTVNASTKEITAVNIPDIDDLIDILNEYQFSGMFNIFGLKKPNGEVYQQIRYTHATGLGYFQPGNGIYMGSGSDGDIFNKNVFRSKFTDFFSLSLNPYIEDSARYPFTHVFDAGYHMENKFDLLDFLALRDDVIAEIGTNIKPYYHEDNRHTGINTEFEDHSIGASLRGYAQNVKESVIKGTPSCRANIYATSGIIPGIKDPCGLQYWIAGKLAAYENLNYLDKEITGLPNAEVDIFTKMNWVPSAASLKELLWDSGLNYAQYFDMKRFHVASLRSVYYNDSSTLSDAGFVRHLVYVKHEVRSVWAMFSGVKLPKHVMQAQLETAVIEKLTRLFNNKYVFTVKAYQTETDDALGFVQRVQINITSGSPYRVGPFDIVCHKDGAINDI